MNTFSTSLRSPPGICARPTPPEAITALDDWLFQQESAFPDIKPGNAKGIVWAQGAGQQTAWSVVYLHGFSASRLESSPLPETVAQRLGANLFCTRLSGHGRRDANALGHATLEDWQADAREAVQIGAILGTRVLLMGCSTGATLATWLGLSGHAQSVAACVLLSPNFGLKDRRSKLLHLPFGKALALRWMGPVHRWEPESAEQALGWTSSYPTQALFPMVTLVRLVRKSKLAKFCTPVLILLSDADQTVDARDTRAVFQRLGSACKSLVEITYSKAKGQHVLAGTVKDPEAVAPMAETIVMWVSALKQAG